MDNEQLIATLNGMNDNTEKLTRVIDELAKNTAFGQPKTKSNKEPKEQIKTTLKEIDKAAKLFLNVAEQEEEIVKENNKTLEEFQKAVDDSKIGITKLSKVQKEAINEHGTFAQKSALFAANLPTDSLEKYNEKLGKKLGYFGKMIGPVSKKSMVAAAGLGTLSIAVGAVVGRLMATIESSGDLAKSGAMFNGSIGEIAGTAASLNMSLDEFAALAGSNARTFNLAGKSLANQALDSSAQLRTLGLTTSEGAEFLTEYADRQRRLGFVESIGSQRQAMAASGLLAATNELSATFGSSVSDISDSISKAYDNPMVRSALMALPESVAQTFDDQLAFFSAASPQLADMFTDVFSSEIPQLSDSFQQAVQAGVPGIADSMATFADRVKNENLSDAEVEAARMTMLKDLANVDTNFLRIQANNGNQAAAAMLEQALAAREAVKQQEAFNALSDDDKKIKLAQQAEQLTASAKLREFSSTISNFGSKMIGGFLEGLGEDSDAVAKTLSAITETATSFAKVLGSIGKRFGEFLSLPGWVTIPTAIAAIVGVKKLLGSKLMPKSISTQMVMLNAKKVLGGMGGGFESVEDKSKGGKGKGRGGRMSRMFGKAKGMLGGIFGAGGAAGATGIAGKIPVLAVIIGAVGGIVESFTSFSEKFKETGSILRSVVSGLGGFITGFFRAIIGTVTGTFDLLFGTDVTGYVNDIIDIISSFFGGIVDKVFAYFKGNDTDTPHSNSGTGRLERRNKIGVFEQAQDNEETAQKTINTSTTTQKNTPADSSMMAIVESVLGLVSVTKEQNRLIAVQTNEIKKAGDAV